MEDDKLKKNQAERKWSEKKISIEKKTKDTIRQKKVLVEEITIQTQSHGTHPKEILLFSHQDTTDLRMVMEKKTTSVSYNTKSIRCHQTLCSRTIFLGIFFYLLIYLH